MDAFVSVAVKLVWISVLWVRCPVTANRRERIIKGLLNESHYDNRIPPNYEDNFPTSVTVQVFILSLASVKEASMVTPDSDQSSASLPYSTASSSSSGYTPPRFDYSVTIFLREQWHDKRLQWGTDDFRNFSRCNNNNNKNNNDDKYDTNCPSFNGDGVNKNDTPSSAGNNADGNGNDDDVDDDEVDDDEILERLELDSKLLSMVWSPDLYFINEKEAVIHDVTTANRMLHVHRNGSISTSSRISMTLSCDMYLERYPHDEQTCSMYLGSYSYSSDNVVFRWHEVPVLMREGVTLPRFKVTVGQTGPCGLRFGAGSMISGNYTCIRVDFHLVREFGYYIAQVYIPSCLIVALSWVSFWIDLDAIPARVSLGLLTVLTMTTQSTGEKAHLPRVSYLKAIDVWMAGCLVFVFGALLEFAYVNVQSRVEKRRRESVRSPPHHHHHQHHHDPSSSSSLQEGAAEGDRDREGVGGVVKRVHSSGFKNGAANMVPSTFDTEFRPVADSGVEVTVHREGSRTRTQTFFNSYRSAKEKARKADKCSRFLFPLAFLVFNIIYWVVFAI